MAELIERDLNHPGLRVAHSGFDQAHGCGLIACKDPEGAEWFKVRVAEMVGPNGESYRAWGLNDQPTSRLCRIFIPDRFRTLTDSRLLPLILRLNPLFKKGDIYLKDIMTVRGGRAVLLEVDMDIYAQVRLRGYKLGWIMGTIDCQGVTAVVAASEGGGGDPKNQN